ncbi:penicillin-binding protein 2 [Acidimicrobiaceae bacterium USS-CC1]|uniref:Penicillin-binding protein 2 n=1 Tax=Acidiferrimicrobium australe TaxID=2664430 RepID=A0ABW9QV80_9ACTN|nr:penicillin-binding protein 2 [Acidiferrimicrobium australe]
MSAPVPGDASRLRMTVILIVAGCLFAALLTRLWFLQVVSAPAADQRVAAASYISVYTPAPRGEILDRYGRVLVANRQIPVIEVEQSAATNGPLVARLAALLGMSVRATRAAILNNRYSPLAPVPIYLGASAAQILYIEEHRPLFPASEVTATTEDMPYVTPLGESAGNLLGYVGQVDAHELAALQKAYPAKHYRAGDLVGQAGLEAELEPYLAGTPGRTDYEINSAGQVLGILRSIPAVPGHDVRLTLDARVQEVADRAIGQGQAAARATPAGNGTFYKAPGGAVVAEDPRNGQILAMATEPSYDPNWFDQGITAKQYRQLTHDKADPLENRAIQGVYAPGSTFKVVTATAGLRSGLVSPGFIFNDTAGVMVIGNQLFHDDNGIGSGYIDLATALTVSSDNYFNSIGANLWDGRSKYGEDYLQKVADSYGFNKPTGIDLPGEAAGYIPTPAMLAANRGGPWYTGYSAQMAIGQWQDEVTPLQLANAYSTFANGGTRYRPTLVLDVETPGGRVVHRFAPVVAGHSLPLSAYDRQAMIQGFRGVVNASNGTAAGDFNGTSLAGEDIAGKTGTAQVQCAGCQVTSVFTSFAPASSPRYVVDCIMEDAGYGASIAAPVVREVYDQIFHKKLQPVTYAPATGSAT